MTARDCPNCHYPAPSRKQDKKETDVPQTPYHIPPEQEPVEECSQCFYQPEEQGDQKTDDCNQCFYHPEK